MVKKLQLLIFCLFFLSFVGFSQGFEKAKEEAYTPLQILAKPQAKYTEAAHGNGFCGIVRLRVVFQANSEIGEIYVVSKLPFGLTEQAITAAKEIRFEPATWHGTPMRIVKEVQYYFSIYYDENDKDLAKKAKILTKTKPEYPLQSDLKKMGGKVRLETIFSFDGTVSVSKALTNLPEEFETKAVEAASKITFTPAINKKGYKVSQRKTIEYEFKPQKK